jgi:cytochrome c-type biogenesis protein CcmE
MATCPTCSARGRAWWPKGPFDAAGTFQARRVLAKHDEKYMPREVAKALKDQGEWRGDGASPSYGKP